MYINVWISYFSVPHDINNATPDTFTFLLIATPPTPLTPPGLPSPRPYSVIGTKWSISCLVKTFATLPYRPLPLLPPLTSPILSLSLHSLSLSPSLSLHCLSTRTESMTNAHTIIIRPCSKARNAMKMEHYRISY